MSDQLQTVLDRARSLGFLGPGSIASQLDHARRFVDVVPTEARVLDLGSGGGLPGLVLADDRPDLGGVLFDGMEKRTTFLSLALRQLGVDHRWDVVRGRAEDTELQATWRRSFDVVTARGFGPPSATFECAAGLLRSGGMIIISEPPVRRRWPEAELAQLGFEVDSTQPGVVMLRRILEVELSPPRSWKKIVKVPLIGVEEV